MAKRRNPQAAALVDELDDEISASNPLDVSAVVAAGDAVIGRVKITDGADVALVTAAGSLNVNIAEGGGAGGTAQADESAFVEGTTSFTPIGGVLNDTITSDPTEDQAAAARITAKRALHVNLRDAAGAEVSVGGGTQYDEDTPHVTADKLTMAGVVQQAADAALSGDGDRSLMQVDGTGYLKVNVKAGSAGGTQYTEDAAAAADPVGTALNLVRQDTPSAATVTLDGDNIAARGNSAGAQYVELLSGVAKIAGDAANGLDVDVTRLPALVAGSANIGDVDVLTVPAPLSTTGGGTEATALRVTLATDSTGVLSVDDNGGSLTVDAATLPLPTGAATAALQTQPGVDIGDVTVNNAAGAAAVNVQDGGNSLTVDGSVSITGAVDTELTTADLDTGAGTDTRAVVGLVGSASGGAAVIPGSATDGLLVNLGANNDVTATLVAGGDVDILTIAAGDNNIGNVAIVTGPTGATAFAVQGTVAHDDVDAQNPVKIGGKANANEPTAVADGDRVDGWFDRLGRLVVLPGHPSPEAPVTANGSAAGLSVIAAPGAGLSLYICKGVVTNVAAAENIISLRDGAAGTIRWTINAAADGGGALFDFGARGWKLTANTALVADIGAATAYINITDWYIAA